MSYTQEDADEDAFHERLYNELGYFEIGGKKSEFFLELMYVCTTSNRSSPSLTRRSFNAGPNYPLAAILDIFQHLP